jgi:hypothetical protein
MSRTFESFDRLRKLYDQFLQDAAATHMTSEERCARAQELMIQDEQGVWWTIAYPSRRWYKHDGTQWTRADPPDVVTSTVKVDTYPWQWLLVLLVCGFLTFVLGIAANEAIERPNQRDLARVVMVAVWIAGGAVSLLVAWRMTQD